VAQFVFAQQTLRPEGAHPRSRAEAVAALNAGANRQRQTEGCCGAVAVLPIALNGSLYGLAIHRWTILAYPRDLSRVCSEDIDRFATSKISPNTQGIDRRASGHGTCGTPPLLWRKRHWSTKRQPLARLEARETLGHHSQMRELFVAIRKHPWIAGITATAVLGAVLKFFLDKLILDGLRDLIFAAMGRWLGISDVNALITLLSYVIPIGLAIAIIWGVYRFAQYNAKVNFGHDPIPQGTTNLKALLPAQGRLLELVAHYQRQFAASKLVVLRETGKLVFDDQPARGDEVNLIRDLYGSVDALDAARFVALVESMPAVYLQLLPETRWDNPFVLTITEAGSEYLRRHASTAATHPRNPKGGIESSSGATVVRTAFDETQRINVLPPTLGGNDVLKLGNLAILRLGMPYSLEMVTLHLDATPMRLPDGKNEKITVEGLTITKGGTTKYTFDTAKNKRHEIVVAGRTYIVTLLESKKLDIPKVSNAKEWVFGITEK